MSTNLNTSASDRDEWTTDAAGNRVRVVRPDHGETIAANRADHEHDYDGDGKKDLEKEAGAGMLAAGTIGAAVGTIAAGPVGGVIGAALGGAAGTAAGKAVHGAREHGDDPPAADERSRS